MRKKAFLGILLVVAFCFSGCNWFGGYNLTPEQKKSGLADYRIQTGETTFPKSDYDSTESEKAENELYSSVSQGVRATYTPKIGEKTTDTVLQADRDKYTQNAKLQYEIIARTILYYLVGNYGYSGGNTGETIVYEFYADKSLLPDGEKFNTSIDLPNIKLYQANDARKSSWDSAIEQQITGITGNYDTENDTWQISRTTTNAYKWNFSLNNTVNANYNTNWIDTFTPYVMLNLMEYFILGKNYITPLNTLLSYGPSQLELEINNLVTKIERLGINANQEYADFLSDYISETIIGTNAIKRESMTFTYNAPSVQKEVEPFDPENPEYETIYYDMDGTGRATVSTNTWYKYNYTDTIQSIVDKVAGEYNTNGETVTPAMSVDFPTYTRLEITDVSPETFYTTGEKQGDLDKLNNMDYRVYQSVVWYPNGIISFDQTKLTSYADTSTKKWLFNTIELNIDSKEDITLDIFMRIHYEGGDTVKHVARYNTDISQSYNYDKQTLTDNLSVDDNSFFNDTKMNSMLIFVPYFFGEDCILSNDGIENTVTKKFYYEQNSYKNTFAGKLGSSVNFGENLTVTNYYDEEVDLSNYNLCNDGNDFVELIFVPKVQENITDYSFKFLLKDFVW